MRDAAVAHHEIAVLEDERRVAEHRRLVGLLRVDRHVGPGAGGRDARDRGRPSSRAGAARVMTAISFSVYSRAIDGSVDMAIAAGGNLAIHSARRSRSISSAKRSG